MSTLYVGTQFVFVEADRKNPSTVTVGQQKRVFTERTIVSRYKQDVSVEGMGYHPALSLPRLEPAFLVTDRKIYKPGSTAWAIALATSREGMRQRVLWNDNPVYERPCDTGVRGIRVDPIEDLQEGRYEVLLLDATGSTVSRCDFTVARYTLSLLEARLASFTVEKGRLDADLEITQLGEPYEGKARIGLACGHCSGRTIAERNERAHNGLVSCRFTLDHPGPFHLHVVSPQGDTASVFLPGTEERHREQVRVGALGKPLDASAAPFPDSSRVREVSFAERDPRAVPLELVSWRGAEGEVRVKGTETPAQVVVIDPRSDWYRIFEPQDGAVRFPVEAPYVLVHAAAWPEGEKPYETFGVVVRPEEAEVAIEGPERATPGEEITLRVRGNRPGACLLVVCDSRLEREEPLPKLGQKYFEHLRAASESSQESTLEPYEPTPTRMFRAEMMPQMAAGLGMIFGSAPEGAESDLALLKDEPAAPATEPRARQDFPELLLCELFDLDGEEERSVRLGDQIGAYRAAAYLFTAEDAVSAECRIEASKETFVELDLPAILAPGETVEALVRYASEGKTELTLTTSRKTHRHEVSGRGSLTLPLDGPGEVIAKIAGPSGEDFLSRTIAPPGRQTVVASRLATLKSGEVAEGLRVVAYPSTGSLTQDAVKALVGYPFG